MGDEAITTIGERATVIRHHRDSRFVAYVSPVRTVEEATALLEEVAADHPDATHLTSSPP